MQDNDSQDSPPLEGEFMRLFVRHEPVLRAYARSILPNWELVDDALQEASVTMWSKLDQLRDEQGFLPWAKVIVRFKCLSIAAKRKRAGATFSETTLELLADEAESVTDESLGEVRTAMRECMRHFSKSHQTLLLSPYDGSGRVQVIAKESGKTVNAMYKLLGRLRQKLRQCVNTRLQTGGI